MKGNLMETSLIGNPIGVAPYLIETQKYAAATQAINEYSIKKSTKGGRSKRTIIQNSGRVQSPHKNNFYSKNGGKPNEDL